MPGDGAVGQVMVDGADQGRALSGSFGLHGQEHEFGGQDFDESVVELCIDADAVACSQGEAILPVTIEGLTLEYLYETTP